MWASLAGTVKAAGAHRVCRHEKKRFVVLYVIHGNLMVLPERIELSTSPLPRECSTPELRQLTHIKMLGQAEPVGDDVVFILGSGGGTTPPSRFCQGLFCKNLSFSSARPRLWLDLLNGCRQIAPDFYIDFIFDIICMNAYMQKD